VPVRRSLPPPPPPAARRPLIAPSHRAAHGTRSQFNPPFSFHGTDQDFLHTRAVCAAWDFVSASATARRWCSEWPPPFHRSLRNEEAPRPAAVAVGGLFIELRLCPHRPHFRDRNQNSDKTRVAGFDCLEGFCLPAFSPYIMARF